MAKAHKKMVVDNAAELAERLQPLESSEICASLDRLRRRYGDEGVDAARIRAELDATMGEKTLSDTLSDVRAGPLPG